MSRISARLARHLWQKGGIHPVPLGVRGVDVNGNGFALDMVGGIEPEVATPEDMDIGSDRILPLADDLIGALAVHDDHLVLFDTLKHTLNPLPGFAKFGSPTVPDSRHNKHTGSNHKENAAQTTDDQGYSPQRKESIDSCRLSIAGHEQHTNRLSATITRRVAPAG